MEALFGLGVVVGTGCSAADPTVAALTPVGLDVVAVAVGATGSSVGKVVPLAVFVVDNDGGAGSVVGGGTVV